MSLIAEPFFRNIMFVTGGASYWIDVTDFGKEGQWYWSFSGRNITRSNWDKGEPRGRYDENCGRKYGITRHYKWADYRCDVLSPYLCELNVHY